MGANPPYSFDLPSRHRLQELRSSLSSLHSECRGQLLDGHRRAQWPSQHRDNIADPTRTRHHTTPARDHEDRHCRERKYGQQYNLVSVLRFLPFWAAHQCCRGIPALLPWLIRPPPLAIKRRSSAQATSRVKSTTRTGNTRTCSYLPLLAGGSI